MNGELLVLAVLMAAGFAVALLERRRQRRAAVRRALAEITEQFRLAQVAVGEQLLPVFRTLARAMAEFAATLGPRGEGNE